MRLRTLKHDLGFDAMPSLRLVYAQLAATCSHLAIAVREIKDPSEVRSPSYTLANSTSARCSAMQCLKRRDSPLPFSDCIQALWMVQVI